MARLSAKRIERLRHQSGRYLDEHGLYLQVGPNGASWIFRYERHNKERWLGLGSLHTFNLDEARERARLARQQLKQGTDPLASKRLAAAKTLSFRECCVAFYDARKHSWTNDRHAKQFLSTLEAHAFPVLGNLPVAVIDTGLVHKVIEPIWTTTTVTANRVRRRIEAVLDWAAVKGYRAGENLARWTGHMEHLLAAIKKSDNHHSALPFADVPQFVIDLRRVEGVPARALEFLVLTGMRTGAILKARWSEFDLPIWHIPAERMKGNKEGHRVPLSQPALDLLAALPRDGSGYVFIGARRSHIHKGSMIRILQKLRPDATVHGFRSAFTDWAHETTSHPKHVIDMALAHTIGDKVEAAYRRGDLFVRRTRLMEDWARFVSTPPVAVTPIRSQVV